MQRNDSAISSNYSLLLLLIGCLCLWDSLFEEFLVQLLRILLLMQNFSILRYLRLGFFMGKRAISLPFHFPVYNLSVLSWRGIY